MWVRGRVRRVDSEGKTVFEGAKGATTGLPAYTRTFPSEPESARRARLLVVVAFGTWGFDSLAETGKLVVSELVANSVEHTACRSVRVTISRLAEERVRIAVIDKDANVPMARAASEQDEDGRGLLIVAALAAAAGTDTFRWGKRVWADLFTRKGGQ
jgi:anti-sigma regulatory factor (Ser/Thr protein kinase)